MTFPHDKPSQDGLRERERRHINREDDPHFDPTDKTAGDKIPGADQTPNHVVNRTADNMPISRRASGRSRGTPVGSLQCGARPRPDPEQKNDSDTD